MSEETQIRVISGLETIGGNIVSLTCGQYQLITDFGALVGADIQTLLDRQKTRELASENLLPQVEGVYASHQLGDLTLASFEESPLSTIICLSHLHLDHVGSLGQIHHDIPVFLSEPAHEFYQKLQEFDYLPHYEVNWQAVNYDQEFSHGPFKICFKESDHDTVGASAIFIQTDDLKVVVSGDCRLTGFEPEKVLEWTKAAHAFAPDLLFMEGTAYSWEDNKDEVPLAIEEQTQSLEAINERQLLNKIKDLILDHKDQLFAINTYPQNVDRIYKLNQLLIQNNRKFVLDQNYYSLLKAYQAEAIESFFYLGRQTEVGNDKLITVDEIKAHPEKYCLLIDFNRHQLMYELPAGIYLHSNGLPLGPYMAGYESFLTGLIDYGWCFYHAEVSGHAYQEDLLTIAYAINPKYIIPWHTYRPIEYGLALADYGLTVFHPELLKKYTLAQIKEADLCSN